MPLPVSFGATNIFQSFRKSNTSRRKKRPAAHAISMLSAGSVPIKSVSANIKNEFDNMNDPTYKRTLSHMRRHSGGCWKDMVVDFVGNLRAVTKDNKKTDQKQVCRHFAGYESIGALRTYRKTWCQSGGSDETHKNESAPTAMPCVRGGYIFRKARGTRPHTELTRSSCRRV